MLSADRSISAVSELLGNAEQGTPTEWPDLQVLNCAHNYVSTIDTSLVSLAALEVLDLSYNLVQRVENLQFCFRLVHLNLAHNRIRSVENTVASLGNLKVLNLASNGLESAVGLEKLLGLERLDISDNQLMQPFDIERLGMLPNLMQLELRANPMTSIAKWRAQVLSLMLRDDLIIDGQPPSSSEKKAVEAKRAETPIIPYAGHSTISKIGTIVTERPAFSSYGRALPSESLDPSMVYDYPELRADVRKVIAEVAVTAQPLYIRPKLAAAAVSVASSPSASPSTQNNAASSPSNPPNAANAAFLAAQKRKQKHPKRRAIAEIADPSKGDSHEEERGQNANSNSGAPGPHHSAFGPDSSFPPFMSPQSGGFGAAITTGSTGGLGEKSGQPLPPQDALSPVGDVNEFGQILKWAEEDRWLQNYNAYRQRVDEVNAQNAAAAAAAAAASSPSFSNASTIQSSTNAESTSTGAMGMAAAPGFNSRAAAALDASSSSLTMESSSFGSQTSSSLNDSGTLSNTPGGGVSRRKIYEIRRQTLAMPSAFTSEMISELEASGSGGSLTDADFDKIAMNMKNGKNSGPATPSSPPNTLNLGSSGQFNASITAVPPQLMQGDQPKEKSQEAANTKPGNPFDEPSESPSDVNTDLQTGEKTVNPSGTSINRTSSPAPEKQNAEPQNSDKSESNTTTNNNTEQSTASNGKGLEKEPQSKISSNASTATQQQDAKPSSTKLIVDTSSTKPSSVKMPLLASPAEEKKDPFTSALAIVNASSASSSGTTSATPEPAAILSEIAALQSAETSSPGSIKDLSKASSTKISSDGSPKGSTKLSSADTTKESTKSAQDHSSKPSPSASPSSSFKMGLSQTPSAAEPSNPSQTDSSSLSSSNIAAPNPKTARPRSAKYTFKNLQDPTAIAGSPKLEESFIDLLDKPSSPKVPSPPPPQEQVSTPPPPAPEVLPSEEFLVSTPSATDASIWEDRIIIVNIKQLEEWDTQGSVVLRLESKELVDVTLDASSANCTLELSYGNSNPRSFSPHSICVYRMESAADASKLEKMLKSILTNSSKKLKCMTCQAQFTMQKMLECAKCGKSTLITFESGATSVPTTSRGSNEGHQRTNSSLGISSSPFGAEGGASSSSSTPEVYHFEDLMDAANIPTNRKIYTRTHHLQDSASGQMEEMHLYFPCYLVPFNTSVQKEQRASIVISDTKMLIFTKRRARKGSVLAFGKTGKEAPALPSEEDYKDEELFASFSLRMLRRIVVGPFWQWFRIENGANSDSCYTMVTRSHARTFRFLQAFKARCGWVEVSNKNKECAANLKTAIQNLLRESKASTMSLVVEMEEFAIDLYFMAYQRVKAGGFNLLSAVRASTAPHLRETTLVPRTVLLTRHNIIVIEEDYAKWPSLAVANWTTPKTPQFSIVHHFSFHDIVSLAITNPYDHQNFVSITFEYNTSSGATSQQQISFITQGEAERTKFIAIVSQRYQEHFHIKLTPDQL